MKSSAVTELFFSEDITYRKKQMFSFSEMNKTIITLEVSDDPPLVLHWRYDARWRRTAVLRELSRLLKRIDKALALESVRTHVESVQSECWLWWLRILSRL